MTPQIDSLVHRICINDEGCSCAGKQRTSKELNWILHNSIHFPMINYSCKYHVENSRQVKTFYCHPSHEYNLESARNWQDHIISRRWSRPGPQGQLCPILFGADFGGSKRCWPKHIGNYIFFPHMEANESQDWPVLEFRGNNFGTSLQEDRNNLGKCSGKASKAHTNGIDDYTFDFNAGNWPVLETRGKIFTHLGMMDTRRYGFNRVLLWQQDDCHTRDCGTNFFSNYWPRPKFRGKTFHNCAKFSSLCMKFCHFSHIICNTYWYWIESMADNGKDDIKERRYIQWDRNISGWSLFDDSCYSCSYCGLWYSFNMHPWLNCTLRSMDWDSYLRILGYPWKKHYLLLWTRALRKNIGGDIYDHKLDATTLMQWLHYQWDTDDAGCRCKLYRLRMASEAVTTGGHGKRKRLSDFTFFPPDGNGNGGDSSVEAHYADPESCPPGAPAGRIPRAGTGTLPPIYDELFSYCLIILGRPDKVPVEALVAETVRCPPGPPAGRSPRAGTGTHPPDYLSFSIFGYFILGWPLEAGFLCRTGQYFTFIEWHFLHCCLAGLYYEYVGRYTYGYWHVALGTCKVSNCYGKILDCHRNKPHSVWLHGDCSGLGCRTRCAHENVALHGRLGHCIPLTAGHGVEDIRYPDEKTGLHRAHGCQRKKVLNENGIERQPGPQTQEECKHIRIQSINATSLQLHADHLMSMDADAIFIQEHAANEPTVNLWKGKMRDMGWTLIASPIGYKTKGSGVAVMSRDTVVPIPLKNPATKEYTEIYDQGLGAIVTMQIGDWMVAVANHYGETGGSKNTQAAMVTDEIVDILITELEHLPDMPAILLGDLNADPYDIPAVTRRIEDLGWFDVGAHASVWGGIDNQPTSRPPNASRSNRRDYIFVSPDLVGIIEKFNVEYTDTFPVHISITIGHDQKVIDIQIRRDLRLLHHCSPGP